MSPISYNDKRCRCCTKFLRTKSTLIPEDKKGVRRLGSTATRHAEAALAALNTQRAAQDSKLPALSFDDPVFAKRLHYREGKTRFPMTAGSRCSR